jgi:hypothetical protein
MSAMRASFMMPNITTTSRHSGCAMNSVMMRM